MKIGILGTGMVGQMLGGKLVEVGHDVAWFGWQDVIDLGDITNARGTEMYLPLWLRLWGALGSGMFNVKVMK
jgi:hypothetical protein